MRIAPVLAATACCFAALGANWPQWRGAEGSGVSEEPNLPAEWSSQKNIAWKTPIPGRGHSSPIVFGKQIFLTTSIEGAILPDAKPVKHKLRGEDFVHPDSVGGRRGQTLKVLALDSETGKILWEQTAYEGAVYDDRHKKNTYASPTPVSDGKHVFVYFESQGLFSYDFNGKLAWKSSLGGIRTLGMGAGTSPVLFEDLVLVQCDQDEGEGSFVAGISKKDGKLVWKTPRKTNISWSTPILVRSGGKHQLIASGDQTIVAYDPKNGKELWHSAGLLANVVPSPVAGHDMVFVSAGYPQKRTYALRLGSPQDRIAWTYEKGTGYVPSPILYGDYLYLMTDKGLVTCLDARTGALRYEGKRVPVPATFSASPVAFDGKIFLTSEDGDTFVLKAGPDHEIVGTNSLGEPVYASPAIANGQLFIRTDKNLYCIRTS